jgi:hypothetical protein
MYVSMYYAYLKFSGLIPPPILWRHSGMLRKDLCMCMYVWIDVCMCYVCTYVCMYVYTCICMHVSVWVCVCMYVRMCMSDVTRWLSEEQRSPVTSKVPNLVLPLNLQHTTIGSQAEVRSQYYTKPRWRCKPYLSALVRFQMYNLRFWCIKAFIVTHSYVRITIPWVCHKIVKVIPVMYSL